MKKFLAALAVVAIVAFAAPAFAANPFMDVPAGHWAYDAVAQLASAGIVSGYPDGAFKGAQPATRYEVASVVARALAYEDLKHASKQDLEMLKRLVMEFKDELDALGVKVDKIDKRVAVLEDRLGGWKLRGILRFDAKFTNGDQDENSGWTAGEAAGVSKNEFSKEQFRLFLTKQIDENTYFETQYRAGAWASQQSKTGNKAYQGRGEASEQSWNKVFVKTKLPYDVDFRVGRFQFDWEGDAGLYNDEDAAFGDWRVDGFEVSKKWGGLKGTALIGRNNSGERRNDIMRVGYAQMLYAANLKWDATDKFFIGGMGYWQQGDGVSDALKENINTYAAYAGYKFTPAVELKGMYYWQKSAERDEAKSWKAILDIKQDALKFTSLWIEYAQEDNWFAGNNDQGWVAKYSLGTYLENGVLTVRPHDQTTTSKYWFVKAEQKWNKKWGTFARYTRADWDTPGQDTATEWGVGATYQYTPAIAFMLAYDQVDFGTGGTSYNQGRVMEGKDNLIIFRTTVKF